MDLVETTMSAGGSNTRHPWELARIEVLRRVLREYVELRPGDVVLDVGCGDAFLSAHLAALYPTVTFCGIDTALDDRLVQQLAGNLTVPNLRLFRSLDAARRLLGERRAALVLLMDVLEHIKDDEAFLQALQRSPLVDSGTHYVVTAPAFRALFSSHDVLLGHYRRYSRRTFEALIKRAGLDPLNVCYFFSSLLLPRFAQAVKEKMLGHRGVRTTLVAEWRGSGSLQRALTALLIWDFSLSWALCRRGIVVPGLSNLAICRRAA